MIGAGPREALPADWTILPQVKAEAQYDSNINFAYVNKKHDYVLSLSPSVDFTYASEISRLTGRFALNGLVYLRDSDLDTLNQYYSLMGQHKVAPRLALTFDGGYILDSTLYEELQASGFVMNRSRREAIRAAPGLAFNLTERSLLRLSYAFNKTNYQDPRFTDYSGHVVNLGLNYLLKNAKTTVTGIVLGRVIDYPSIKNYYRNLSTQAGLEHKFTEDWSISLFAGLNFNSYTSQTAVVDYLFFPSVVRIRQEKEETFSVTPFFNIEGRRRWQKANLDFGYRLDQSASGGGTILEYHNAYAGFNYNLTERLRGGLRGSFYYSTSSSPGSTYENLVFYLSPEINYKITERLSAGSGYRYGWREDPTNNRTTDRHFVWVNLSFAYPIHYQK